MKKRYIQPLVNVVELSVEGGILAASGGQFDIGMSDDVMGGTEALSEKKEMWDTGDMWQ